jgi:hypothetical protein
MQEQSCTVAFAAKHLGISLGKAYSLAAPQGPMPCYRIGSRVIFDLADIEAYKTSVRVEPVEKVSLKLRSRRLLPTSTESSLLATFKRLGIKPRLQMNEK